MSRRGRIPLDAQNNPLPLPRAGGDIPGLPGGLRARAIHALHGDRGGAVYMGVNFEACGYIFDIGGWRVVQPGDSVLLAEQMALRDVDVLLVSPTEHNLGVADACRLIEAVRPRHAGAQHFGTYHETPENAFWTHGEPWAVRDALPEPLRDRFHIPAYGRTIIFDARGGAAYA